MAFLWGSGGRRLTPEQIAQEQQIANALMMEGADYSPVGHWSQGLARLAQGAIGGVRNRRAQDAAAANADESQMIAEALLAGGEGGSQRIADALGNPYIDSGTRELAGTLLKSQLPRQAAPTALQNNFAFLNSLGRDDLAQQLLTNAADPIVMGQVGPGEWFSGPRSALPGVGAPPPPLPMAPETLPPDFDFGGQ